MRYFLIFLSVFWLACQTAPADEKSPAGDKIAGIADYGNPPAEGFNAEDSEPRAIALADSVMAAMGGRQAWDETRYIRWTFFDLRTLTWDKQEQKVRIDFPKEKMVISVSTETDKGWVVKDGEMVGNVKESVASLKKGREIWINDSYWLVMPFKLKDSGVTLKYLGRDTTQTGDPAEVLELTFDGVGVTPGNKYHVFIDPDTWLVSQWAYFAKADEEKPRFILPWGDYQQHGRILLSGDRGERDLTNIAVLDKVDSEFFNNWRIAY